MDWEANLRLPPRFDLIIQARQREQHEAEARQREQHEAEARQREEAARQAREQAELARQARAQAELARQREQADVERVLKMAMYPGDWFAKPLLRLPRLKAAIAAAEHSGLPSTQLLVSQAKVVLALEERGAQSSAAYDKAVRDGFHHHAVHETWMRQQKEKADQEQARQDQFVEFNKLSFDLF